MPDVQTCAVSCINSELALHVRDHSSKAEDWTDIGLKLLNNGDVNLNSHSTCNTSEKTMTCCCRMEMMSANSPQPCHLF